MSVGRDLNSYIRCDLFPGKRIFSTFFLTVSLGFWVRWPAQHPISFETSYTTARVCTVFLPPAWLPSAPFRNPMAAAMAPPVLSSDCPSPGPPSSQQYPGVHAPAILGRCLAAILLKEVHSDRGGATQRRVGGGWELWIVCSELCLGIKDIICSPFPNISLRSLKTPKTSVIPWV